MKPRTGLPKGLDRETRRRVRTMADRRAVLDGCRFDPGRVRKVLDFFRLFCRHSKGSWAGQPVECLEWQVRDIIEPIFGWVRPDGFRRVRRAYVEVPKKNGKSLLASAIANYMLVGDGEPGAEVYCVAYGRQQARIVFDELERMVKASPDLKKHVKPYPSVNRIVFEAGNAFALALSREANLQEGLSAHAVIFDELHVQKTRDLWDALEDAGAARDQPLLLSITTAGQDRNGVGWDQHRYVRSILEGTNDDPAYHGVIYAADEEDDWLEPDVWRKANPSFGVTFSADEFAASARKAKMSIQAEMTFRRRRLNQWVASEARWIHPDVWLKGVDDAIRESDLVGRPCYVGLDLAATRDLCSACLLFADDPDRMVPIWRYWLPEEVATEREQSSRGRFLAWARKGFVTLTGGDVTDYERIKRDLLDLAERFDILEVAYDPWNATHLANQLAEEGLEMVEYRQTFRNLSEPVMRLEVDCSDGKIRHTGDPVTAWCIGNAIVETNAQGDVRLSKKKSPDKIDGAVALAMARGRTLVSSGPTRSCYEERDLREV